MSATALAGLRGLFVEARPREAAGAIPPPRRQPTVAVLCAESRAQAAAASVALALARVTGRPCAIAATVDLAGRPPSGAFAAPAAASAARRLRERGQRASASGRLVRLTAPEADGDVPGVVAAGSAALGRAALAVSAPAALAIPFARVAALDRVLAWHDGIVVVLEPDAPDALVTRALESLEALGRPVATMAPPTGLAAAAASLGLHAPAVALAAVAELRLPDNEPERSR